MKPKHKLLLTVAAITAMGVVVYAIRRKNTNHILTTISDEGYEAASDVLYPEIGKRGRKLHYGPVLPEY